MGLRFLLIGLALSTLLACGAERGFTVQIDPPKKGAKRVDVVSIKNPAGMALIASVNASRWFKERDSIIAARQDEISVQSFEIAAGHKQILYTIEGSGVRAVYLYSLSDIGARRSEAATF